MSHKKVYVNQEDKIPHNVGQKQEEKMKKKIKLAGNKKMQKEFAKAIFCRATEIRILANDYYLGKISESEFLEEFASKIFLIAEAFMIKRGIKIGTHN